MKNKEAEFKFEQCMKCHEVLRNKLKKEYKIYTSRGLTISLQCDACDVNLR